MILRHFIVRRISKFVIVREIILDVQTHSISTNQIITEGIKNNRQNTSSRSHRNHMAQ